MGRRINRGRRFGAALGALAPWSLGAVLAVSIPADAGQDMQAGGSLAPLVWRAPAPPSALIAPQAAALTGAARADGFDPWSATPDALRRASLAGAASGERLPDEIEPRVALKGGPGEVVDRSARSDPDAAARPSFAALLSDDAALARLRAASFLFDHDANEPASAFDPAAPAGDAEAFQPSTGEAGAAPAPAEPASRFPLALLAGPDAENERRCLAEAVYFEARGESGIGQAAVAQVVLNRVASGLYPATICGVVHQNRERRNACQFSYACDGRPLRIREPDAWASAEQIADEALSGKAYLPDVGGATHYHADYARPRWARSLEKLDVIGRHVFYKLRPGQT